MNIDETYRQMPLLSFAHQSIKSLPKRSTAGFQGHRPDRIPLFRPHE